MNALSQASTPLAQKMYAEQPQPGAAAQGDASDNKAGDDVVDAEFEEVKENK
ncbi:Chaperone protein DnaK [compost metagenome]